MSTDQEYWDACLIRAWRHDLRITDAMRMFESITGKNIKDCPLLRRPLGGFPWKLRVRIFVAERLPKISDRLWDQPPGKDVALLKKLSTSSYDTTDGNSLPRIDTWKAGKETNKAMAKVVLNNMLYGARNSATDWGVVKGHARIRRAR